MNTPINNYIFFIFLSVLLSVLYGCSTNKLPENSVDTNELPDIFPDYVQVTIPPNIAPLNFIIKEKGSKFAVRIYSKNKNELIINSNSPNIQIDESGWHDLLNANKGEKLHFEIFCFNNDKWLKYKSFDNQIAQDSIDSYLTYRLINTGYVLWTKMGLYQRNLGNFDESAIITNTPLDNACVNCHSMCKNNPEKSLFHIRASYSGTILKNVDVLEKLNTKTDYTMSAAVYPAWHPNGRHIAFSVNKINQYFYSMGAKSIEVSDLHSDLIVYDTKTRTVTTSPKVSTKNRENLPEWSADGKTIFFISAPEATDRQIRVSAKYSLMKIPYDVEHNIWGEVDTVISASEIGKSITYPRVSPDGNFLIFCTTKQGYFTIHHPESDLNILNLKTGEYKEATALNSHQAESYHSWSTNSRWLVFSSRRIDGLHTRTFIAHIDKNGNCAKPFVLPQKNPDFYNSYFLNFNRPELMIARMSTSVQELRDAIYEDPINANFDKTVELDALSGATKVKE